MDYKEILLIIAIPINLILAAIAITTFTKEHREGKITNTALKVKIAVSVLFPIAGFVFSKLS